MPYRIRTGTEPRRPAALAETAATRPHSRPSTLHWPRGLAHVVSRSDVNLARDTPELIEPNRHNPIAINCWRLIIRPTETCCLAKGALRGMGQLSSPGKQYCAQLASSRWPQKVKTRGETHCLSLELELAKAFAMVIPLAPSMGELKEELKKRLQKTRPLSSRLKRSKRRSVGWRRAKDEAVTRRA